jgi:His/Glu/Gln/Arg/opine family amino acid ABC transporter permease subunit
MGADPSAFVIPVAELRTELELVQVTSPQRIPALLAGRADVAISSLSITFDRAKTVMFAPPHGALSIVIAGARKTNIKAAADTAGKKIGLTRATFLRTAGPRPCRAAIATYVEIIRNTPFLVQLFVIYFSLPAIGIRLEAVTAALLGMSLNFWGYATEIVRSGIEAVPRSQIEAGYSLGLSRLQIFRSIIAFPDAGSAI